MFDPVHSPTDLAANQEFPMSNTHNTAFSAKKILLPIDFSASSEAALEAATGLAQQFHAAIHLVHIIPEIPDYDGIGLFPETRVLKERREIIEQKLVANTERLLLKGIPASFCIEEGNDTVGILMRVIKRENTDMLVISTHGMSGWRPFIFGSIAEQLIKQVNCSLLLLQSGRPVSAAKEPALAVWDECFVPCADETEHAGSAIPKPETLSEKRLERVAENLAERGGRTERQYDEAHPLFTK
jgi:nucleotide-binding universal stress UspA family protein